MRTVEWKAPATSETIRSPSCSPSSHSPNCSGTTWNGSVPLHVAPKLPSPKDQSSPSLVRMRECTSPRLKAAMARGKGTRMGTATISESASSSGGAGSIGVCSGGTPHWPRELSPNMIREPSDSNAPEVMRPAPTATARKCVYGGGQKTRRGGRRVTGVALAMRGLPSCPIESSPKVSTTPEASRSTRWSSPACISAMAWRGPGKAIRSSERAPSMTTCCSAWLSAVVPGVRHAWPHDTGQFSAMKAATSHSPIWAHM